MEGFFFFFPPMSLQRAKQWTLECTVWVKPTISALFPLFVEWCPQLLWLPGPSSTDLLGTHSSLSWGSWRPVGRLACSSSRSPKWGTSHLPTCRHLWWGQRLSAEDWNPGETGWISFWSHCGSPPGETSATPQPDESWGVRPGAMLSPCGYIFI